MAACAATRPRSSAALRDARHWTDQRRNRVEHDASRREGLPRSLLENSIGRGYPLRMVKLQQKISSCWRTLAAAEAFLALRSYVPTARKQGMNPLAVLRQLLRAAPGYQPR